MNQARQDVAGAAAVAVLFLCMSVAVRYIDADLFVLAEGVGMYGIFLYVVVTVLAVAVAPVSTVPLMPLATGLWGPMTAALLSIVGWTVGSALVFLMVRRFGRPFAGRFVSLKQLKRFEGRLPRRNRFMIVVVMRMVLPVDLLSYALGLFSRMPFWEYLLATLVGVTPFAFVFSYAVELPLEYQFLGGALLVLIFFVALVPIMRRR